MNGVDPDLLDAWAGARSKARGLPAPISDHGGFRVETGSAAETRRWIFPDATDGLRDLAGRIDQPRVLLKACATVNAVAALIPPRWSVEPTGWVMLHPGEPDTHGATPPGFTLDTDHNPLSCTAIINTDDGALAASGHAAEAGGVFIYDRIVVEPRFQRLGLGTTLMAALSGFRPAGSQAMLIATDDGRALYETLGWSVVAPYSTAQIRDDR